MYFKRIKDLIFKNLLEFIFYLFVFLLPWQTRWIIHSEGAGGQIFEYGRISLYAFDIVLFVLMLIAVLTVKKTNRVRRPIKPETRAALFLAIAVAVYSLLSASWAADKLLAVYWGIRMLGGLALFWLVARQIDFSGAKLAAAVVAAGSIQGLLAIWQFTQQAVWSSKWLGMAGQSAQRLGASVVEFGIERWLRAYGSLPHPNVLGAWLVLSLAAAFYLVPRAKSKYYKLFLIFSSGIIVLGILFAYSRAAWLVFAAVYIGGAAWLLGGGHGRAVKNFAAVWLVYLAVLLAFFASATWPLIKTRLDMGAPNRLEIKSNTERIASWRQAGELFEKNIWRGVGMGNYCLSLKKEQPSLKGWQVQPAHNTWLLALAELGLFGFGLLAALNIYLMFSLYKKHQGRLALTLLLLYFLMFFDHFWWTLATGLYIWWLVMALAWRFTDEEGQL